MKDLFETLADVTKPQIELVDPENTNQDAKSQNRMILEYLKSGKKITPRLARRLFSCDRLSARIYDLKMSGIEIQSEWMRISKEKKVKTYWIEQ